MNLDKKIFKNKSLSDLFGEIYDNSNKKEKLIKELIDQLKPMVKEPGDAMILVPIIKEYLELGIKNDEHLIKMANIIQRALVNNQSEEDNFSLSEQDKKSLYDELQKLPINKN